MPFDRRRFLQMACGAAALPLVPRQGAAASYPAQPVRLIVPYAPGGTTDTIARLIGPWLQEKLGQSFVVESRPGAGTNIGTAAVAHAAPDGYTLLLFDPAAAINATLYENLNFNFIKDIAPVIQIFRTPFVMAVPPSFPAKTLAEFVAYAKTNPGKVNMASAGNGTGSQLAGELFQPKAGIKMTHVPFRGGGPAIAALLGAQVDVFYSPMAIAISHIKAGKLRALAVTSATRSEALPDVPAAGEAVPGYETTYWVGLGAPKATPAAVIDTLNKEINAALADEKIRARFTELGGAGVGGSSADCAKRVADETAVWATVIERAQIKKIE